MPLSQARPMRISGVHYFRIRVPRDLVAVVGRKFLKESLRTKDAREARRLHAMRLARCHEEWARLRRGEPAAPDPERLTDRQMSAVAGEVYRTVRAGPGPEERDIDVQEAYGEMADGLAAALAADPERPTGQGLPPYHRIERLVGHFVDEVLQRRGIACSEYERVRIVLLSAEAARLAAERILRECAGDWRPDPAADRFPKLEVGDSARDPKTSTMIEHIWAALTPGISKSTARIYRRAINGLLAFAGTKDLARVTRDQVKAWRDNMLEKGVSPRTVEREYLRSVKSVYSFAIREDRLSESPAKGVAVQAARRQKGKQMGASPTMRPRKSCALRSCPCRKASGRS